MKSIKSMRKGLVIVAVCSCNNKLLLYDIFYFFIYINERFIVHWVLSMTWVATNLETHIMPHIHKTFVIWAKIFKDSLKDLHSSYKILLVVTHNSQRVHEQTFNYSKSCVHYRCEFNYLWIHSTQYRKSAYFVSIAKIVDAQIVRKVDCIIVANV